MTSLFGQPTSLTSIACLPTREKYYSEDANAPLERIGEFYLYTTDNGIPYYFNARTKKVVWDRPYRDIIPSPESSDNEQDEDGDIDTINQPNRMESIPFGNTPFPNMKDHNNNNESSSDEDECDQDMDDIHNHNKNKRIDINDYFKTDKDKQDEQLQYDPQYNSNIPPARLTYPANELELLLQSKIHEFTPKLGSKNIGCCTFNITPELPEGVDFDIHTGIISGYPMKCTNKKVLYTITATNTHGNTCCDIEIIVKQSDNFTDDNYNNDDRNNTAVTFGFSAKKPTLVKETKELNFDSKEEALAAFYELLANKGIRSSSTWNSMQHKLHRDPRYTALKTEQERKCAFAKYKTDLIFASGNNALILAEKERLKRLRIDFKNCLREIFNLNRLEYILKTYAKSPSDNDNTQDNDESDDEDDEIDNDVGDRLHMDELCKELQGDERYHGLDDAPEERQHMVMDHIQVLEYQRDLEIEQARKRKALERKQDFMMLLHELSFVRQHPLFHSKTQFKDVCKDEMFVSDERFAVFVNEDKLKVATQYFEEFCIAMEHTLEADKQILKSFLRHGRHCINHNDTVEQLVKYYGKSSRLSMIDKPHLKLLFKEMIGKQQHLVKAGVIPMRSENSNRRAPYRKRYGYDRNSGTHANDKYDKYERDKYERDKYGKDKYDRYDKYSKKNNNDRHDKKYDKYERDKGRDKARHNKYDKYKQDKDREKDRDRDRPRPRNTRWDDKYEDKDKDSDRNKDKDKEKEKERDRDRTRDRDMNRRYTKYNDNADRKNRRSKSPAISKGTPQQIEKKVKKQSTPDILVKPKPKAKPKEEDNESNKSLTPNVITKPKPKPKPKPKSKPKQKEDGEIEDNEPKKHKKSSKRNKDSKRDSKKREKKDNYKHKSKDNIKGKTKRIDKKDKIKKKDQSKRKDKSTKKDNHSHPDKRIKRKYDKLSKLQNNGSKDKPDKSYKSIKNTDKLKERDRDRNTDRERDTTKNKSKYDNRQNNSMRHRSFSKSSNDNNNNNERSDRSDRWRGHSNDENNIDKDKKRKRDGNNNDRSDRWQPQQQNHKKRKRDANNNEPPNKKQRVRDGTSKDKSSTNHISKRKQNDRMNQKRIDDNDRWKPSQYSHSVHSDYKRYRDRASNMDNKQEKLRDKHRTPRERMLRQKLLANVHSKR